MLVILSLSELDDQVVAIRNMFDFAIEQMSQLKVLCDNCHTSITRSH